MTIYLSETPAIAAAVIGTTAPDVSPATLRTYRRTIARMTAYLSDIPAEEVTRDQYAAWHDWLATRPTCKPITVNTYRRTARAVWNRLRARGLAVCDIEGITRLIDTGPPSGKATSADWLDRALQVSGPRETAVILYMIEAGFRRQTVPRLRVDDTLIWQGPDGRFRIASRIPQEKTSPPRLIMAGHRAAVGVMNWLNIRKFTGSPWLFCSLSTGDQLAVQTVNSAFTNIRQRGNVPTWARFHPHALRHLFAQQQLQAHDAKIVSQWMGISVTTLLNTYAVRTEQDLALARFGDMEIPPELFSGVMLNGR